MIPILIEVENDPIVSISELNQILALENEQGSNIEIQLKNAIEKIDIVFIAGLILYNKQHKTKFSITGNFLSDQRKFEVRQYLRQYEKIFISNWKDFFTDIALLSIKVKDEIIENELIDRIDYLASESFVPIILVNASSIDELFKQELSKTTGELLTLCQKYIDQKLKGDSEKEREYLNSKKSITNQLINHSPIYTFVFTVLYKKIDPFVKSKVKGIDDPEKRIKELWEFTNEYVKGLHELAKNIVEHSSTGEGIITIRAYDEIEQKAEKIDKVLEIHVFDFGETGIIQKLIEDTQKRINEHRVYEEDLPILTNPEEPINMKDFIKPTVTKKLNQQLYRDLAHYGLMKFYKLIEKNDGLVFSSSTKPNGDRDWYPNNHDKALNLGTSYFFQLPFKPDLFQPSDKVTSQSSAQGSPQTLEGLFELMKIKVVKDIDGITDNGGYLLLDFKPPSININIQNREDENTLFRSFTNLHLNGNTIKYLAINMKEVALSASSLLRFLAHLSTNYSQAIILYNLDFELYDEMLEDNKQFYSTVKDLQEENRIPYWYENKALLIFSILKNEIFSFADVLFGENEEEFETANHILSHTFPNTLSITKGNIADSEKGIADSENFKIPSCLEPFFYQSSLLPFDLLLFVEAKKTLFQSNLEISLNKEIHKTL